MTALYAVVRLTSCCKKFVSITGVYINKDDAMKHDRDWGDDSVYRIIEIDSAQMCKELYDFMKQRQIIIEHMRMVKDLEDHKKKKPN